MLKEKLIAYFEYKYNRATYMSDLYEVDPSTGISRQPRFRSGDLVRHVDSGRKARYLTPAFWDERKGISLVHYLDRPFKVNGQFGYDYVEDVLIEKIEP